MGPCGIRTYMMDILFELSGELPDHPFQLSDSGLILEKMSRTCKHLLWVLEKFSFSQANSIILEARKGHVDTIVIVRIDRWARDLTELVMDIDELVNKHNVRFVAIQNGFDFSVDSYNATDRLMFQIFGAFAEFERAIIRERTIEGIDRVKAQGKKVGRPRKKRRRG